MLYSLSKTWIYALFICQATLWKSDKDLEITNERAVLQTNYTTALSTQTREETTLKNTQFASC